MKTEVFWDKTPCRLVSADVLPPTWGTNQKSHVGSMMSQSAYTQ